jgi:hypothetical protein
MQDCGGIGVGWRLMFSISNMANVREEGDRGRGMRDEEGTREWSKRCWVGGNC